MACRNRAFQLRALRKSYDKHSYFGSDCKCLLYRRLLVLSHLDICNNFAFFNPFFFFFQSFAPCEFLPFNNCSENVSLQDLCQLYIKTTLSVLVSICFVFTRLAELLKTRILLLRCSPAYRRYVIVRLQYVLHFLLFINFLDFLNVTMQ